MDDWAIRTGVGKDFESVLDLWRAAGSQPTATDSAAGLERLLDRDPGALLLAESAGEVVGSVIAAWDGWRGSFYRLAVHPRRRRRGIATALVRSGEVRLRALGAVRLTAIVASEDDGAEALWQAAGYELQSGRGRLVRVF